MKIGNLYKIRNNNTPFVHLDGIHYFVTIACNEIILLLDDKIYENPGYCDYKILYKNKVGFIECYDLCIDEIEY